MEGVEQMSPVIFQLIDCSFVSGVENLECWNDISIRMHKISLFFVSPFNQQIFQLWTKAPLQELWGSEPNTKGPRQSFVGLCIWSQADRCQQGLQNQQELATWPQPPLASGRGRPREGSHGQTLIGKRDFIEVQSCQGEILALCLNKAKQKQMPSFDTLERARGTSGGAPSLKSHSMEAEVVGNNLSQGKVRATSEFPATIAVQLTAGETYFSPVAPWVLRLYDWGFGGDQETDKSVKEHEKHVVPADCF